MKKCKYCSMEIPAEEKVCPYCTKQLATKPLYVVIAVLLGLATIALAAGMIKPSSSGLHGTNKSNVAQQPPTDPWKGKDDEAVEKVKRCNIPSGGPVMQNITALLDTAKAMGSFIEFEGWAGFQINGPVYEVDMAYKTNGVKKTATWDVNLENKSIKAKNQEAYLFNGRNDILVF